MKIYAVMQESWNGEYDVTSVYILYSDKAKATELVETVMHLPEGKERSPYCTKYWVEEMEVHQ